MQRVPHAYILRPPYLYGPMNNVYREAFIFDCALKDRKFYLPGNGEMKLHFFYITDLCRCIDAILDQRPDTHVLNVGNYETISIRDWVKMGYLVAGKKAEFVEVHETIEQREYFSFYNYEYQLDVTRQSHILPQNILLIQGMKESFTWYLSNQDSVMHKNYMEYIDRHF